jgi:hypothetical protein
MEWQCEEEKQAAESFRHPYSCAQAVYAAFEKTPDEETLYMLKANSGGNAPGGICGALFAAHELTDESKHAQLDTYFKNAVGALSCNQIKRECKTPCTQCVIHAVRAVMMMK